MVPRVPGSHNRQNHPLPAGTFLAGLLGWVRERPGLLVLPGADLEPAHLPQPLRDSPADPFLCGARFIPLFFPILIPWLETRPVAHYPPFALQMQALGTKGLVLTRCLVSQAKVDSGIDELYSTSSFGKAGHIGYTSCSAGGARKTCLKRKRNMSKEKRSSEESKLGN